MAMNDTIDISSSDSDLEDTTRSANFRTLPKTLTGSGSNSNFRGYAGQSRKVTSPHHGTYASNGSSLNVNGHTREIVPNHPHYSDDVGPSSQNFARVQPAKYPADGDVYQHQTVNSRISNFGNEFEKISSQQALKRTLPSSILPSTSNAELRSNNHIWDAYGVPHHSAGSSSNYNKSYSRDPSSMGSGSDGYTYENSGSRILPSSTQPRSVSATFAANFAAAIDSAHRFGTGEERASESGERLIYQAALENINQPNIEATLPDGLLSVPLLKHQRIALAWMLQKETRSFHCLGGILADDQGLGKTVSMIALIQMQKYIKAQSKQEDSGSRKTIALDIDDDDDENGDNGNVGSTNTKKIAESVDVRPTKTVSLDIDDNDEGINGNADSSNVKTEESDDIKPIPEVSTSARVFNKRRPDAGTLVVCPASVLRQWARELEDKVAEESKLSVLVYHGGSRTKDPAELAKYDVVVTTYSILTNEVPKQPLVDEEEDEKNGEGYGLSSEFSNKRKKKVSSNNKKGRKGRKGFDSSSVDYDCGALARVGWLRVILDEAQTIKNHRTQVARACCSLRAKTRWCLSGTPIQNTIDDLYSYFRFLRYDPYSTYRLFCSTIKLPISRNSVQGYKKLQAVLRAVMLRRTKSTLLGGEPIIKLPPKTVHMCKVSFSSEERAFYKQLEADSRTQFKAYAAAGTVNQNYANILLMLLRLRQACDHPFLVKEYEADHIGKDSAEMARRLPQDMLINLLNLLESSWAICHKCEDPPEDPVVTMCGHVFCYECVSEYLTGDDNICPASGCKEQIGSDVVFSKPTLRRSISDDLDGGSEDLQFVDKSSLVRQTDYSSSKIKALLEILQSNCKQDCTDSKSFSDGGGNENSSLEKENADGDNADVSVVKHTTQVSDLPNGGPVKTIIFSQWTSMLDLVEAALRQACIKYRRLDGQMSLAARDRGVKDFNTNPEVTVMIMSLKAGNLGLNMVAACHVVILDLWWNPTTEDQAVDRAHRIGQTRAVTVTRLTIKDTVEDRILALQEEKRKMVASAFGEDHGGGSGTRLTVDDLKYLFMV